MPTTEVRVYEDPKELALAAADLFLARTSRKRPFSVALSGGTTPGPVYEQIATLEVDWIDLDVWLVDERFVPPTHPDSNEGLVRRSWIDKVGVPKSKFHPMYQESSPEEAAYAYEQAWLDIFGFGGPDLVFLGIGSDGHTASIFPGDEGAFQSEKLVLPTTSPAGQAQRLSLSPLALSRCTELVFLATGKAKAPYISKMRERQGDCPACRVAKSAGRVTIFTDPAGASFAS